MQNQTVFKHMSAVRSAAPETGLKSFFAMIRSSTLKKTRKRKGCHTEGIGQDMSRQNQPEIFGCFLPNNNKLELQKSTLVEKAVLWWRNKHLGLIEKWTDRYLENSGVFFFFLINILLFFSHLYLGIFFFSQIKHDIFHIPTFFSNTGVSVPSGQSEDDTAPPSGSLLSLPLVVRDHTLTFPQSL